MMKGKNFNLKLKKQNEEESCQKKKEKLTIKSIEKKNQKNESTISCKSTIKWEDIRWIQMTPNMLF